MENEEKKVTEEKPQRPFVKSVLEFQSRLKFCEKIITSLVFTNVLFALIIGVGVFENPLVIMEKDSEKLSFQSERREVEITEKEIKRLVENFIRRRYVVLVIEKSPTSVAEKSPTSWLIKTIPTDQIALVIYP